MSEGKRIQELERRVQQLQTECAVKDVHIGKLAEQLKRRGAEVTPRIDTNAKDNEIETLKQEKKKLEKLVEKLFVLLDKSEKMREYTLRLKHIDIIEDELHDMLRRNC
jgi:predicted CopG family antitoxin